MVNMWEHLTSSVYDATVTNNNDWVIHGSVGYAVDLENVYYIQLNDQQVDSGCWDSKEQDYDTYDYNDTSGLCCGFYGSNLSSAKIFLHSSLSLQRNTIKLLLLVNIDQHSPLIWPN